MNFILSGVENIGFLLNQVLRLTPFLVAWVAGQLEQLANCETGELWATPVIISSKFGKCNICYFFL